MDNLSTVDKLAGPNLSFIERFHCIIDWDLFKYTYTHTSTHEPTHSNVNQFIGSFNRFIASLHSTPPPLPFPIHQLPHFISCCAARWTPRTVSLSAMSSTFNYIGCRLVLHSLEIHTMDMKSETVLVQETL